MPYSDPSPWVALFAVSVALNAQPLSPEAALILARVVLACFAVALAYGLYRVALLPLEPTVRPLPGELGSTFYGRARSERSGRLKPDADKAVGKG